MENASGSTEPSDLYHSNNFSSGQKSNVVRKLQFPDEKARTPIPAHGQEKLYERARTPTFIEDPEWILESPYD